MTGKRSSHTRERRVRWRELVAEAVAGGLDAIDARRIGVEASGWEGPEWTLHLDDHASELGRRRFDALTARRQAGEPLQYVLGRWAFRRLDLLVDRRVLIPRPETEWVVDVALQSLPGDRPATVVDLGAGSGAIALAIADERWPNVRVIATDADGDALAVTRANLAGLGRKAAAVELRPGEWYDALEPQLRGEVDLAVSNPPYVAADDALPAEVADWEPRHALVAGPTGLEALAAIIAGAPGWLAPGGALVCEIGDTQGDAVRTLARDAGFVDIDVLPDLAGRDRVLVATTRRPPG